MAVPPPPPWRRAALRRRTLLVLAVLGQTGAATLLLWHLLPASLALVPGMALTLIFAILFTWISVGFWTAAGGFVLRRSGGDPHSLIRRHSPRALAGTPLAPTAIVMPVCHEPVDRTFQGLQAVYRELERSGQLAHFDIFILSDSQEPDIWLQEQAAWRTLCRKLTGSNRLFYRRRKVNLNYKSGNIADFLRRWGSHYRYMIVLDADSLMSGQTLLTLVRLMEREPAAGIIQTSPTLVRARTPFARLQQFANQAYSPLFATGLAAIQLGEGCFWGHNAIIRVEAFMSHCGLRKLRGAGLFRGPVISHDFVEAALIGRAGYEVWLEPELAGSHEESPPTLEDELLRDRRWARGNLQHLAFLLFEPGLRLAHRMALLNGVMSYLAAPLWLAFLLLSLVVLAQPALAPDPNALEAARALPWLGVSAPQLAAALLTGTLVLLFGPRLLTLLDAVFSGTARRFGGFWQMTRSLLLETLVSVFLAPVRMLAHSRFVVTALLNVSLRWGGQNRSSDTRWQNALRWHGPGTLLGLAWLAMGIWLDPGLFLWSLPVVVPLILAPALSMLLGRTRAGDRLQRGGWLAVTPSADTARLLQEADSPLHRASDPAGDSAPELSEIEQALVLPDLNRLHQQLARQPQARVRRLHLARLCQTCLKQGPDALDRQEISQLMSDRHSLEWLHRAIWSSPPGSFWEQRIRQAVQTTPLPPSSAL